MKFGQLVSRNLGKPVSVAEALIGRSTKWIADKFGVSDTTARRWRRGTQQPRDDDRRNSALKSPDKDTRRHIAANAMRGASAINVGKIGVDADTGRGKGQRRLGIVQLGAEGRERMARAAEALENGDEALAAQLQSDAILHADGRDYGPLHVEDYGPGFHFI
jgi:hypothetical protein